MAHSVRTPENLPALHTGGKVAAIVPTTFNEAVQIAGAIVRAGMAPKGYEGNIEKATVAILAGLEVGFTPFAALQSIAVINGTPSVFGDGLVALVRASGLLEDIQETLDVDDNGVPQAAICRVKRKGEATWGEQIVTRAQCAKAGWLQKQGPWTQTPGRMMSIRARAWAFRDRFADVLRGLKSAEEMQDMVDVTPQGSAAVAEPQRKDFETKPSADVSPHDDPAGGGQAGTTPPPVVGGDSKPEAADTPAPNPKVTDVADLNDKKEDEPITFEMFSTARAFFEFSDGWLEDPIRTPAEAQAWEKFYREKIKEMAEHKFERIREAIAMTLGLYSAVLARETQG